MTLDLTPPEVLRLAQALMSVPEGVCVANDKDELTLWVNDVHTRSLGEKVSVELKREDVKELLAQR